MEQQRIKSVESDIRFFESFPDCYASYLRAFRKIALSPNQQCYQHLTQLTSLQDVVPDSIYYRKLVNLCLRANTSEEPGRMLQQMIHKVGMSLTGIEGFVSIELYSAAEHLLFWQFYFCTQKSNVKLEENYHQIIEFARKKHPEQLRIIELAYFLFYSKSCPVTSSKILPIATKDYYNEFREALQSMESSNTEHSQGQYFNLFPDTWDALYVIMGYSPQGKFPNLQTRYGRYFVQFDRRRLNSISIDKYFDRIIQLSCGGLWEADAVGEFQSQIINLLKNDYQRELFSFLSIKPINCQFLFWQFIFSCPSKDSIRLQDYEKIIQTVTRVEGLNQEVVFLAFELFFGNAPAICLCHK